MLLAAKQTGCVEEVLTIASALAVPDPRITPFDAVDKARAKHRELDDEKSDFLSYLRIWNGWQTIVRSSSNRAGRKFCEQHFLSVMRMFEWQDLRRQLKSALGELERGKSKPSRTEATPDAIHQAVLTGLLGNVATHHESREYLGTRSTRLTVHPSSVLRGKTPKWIMAAELLETSELYGRTLAPVKPQWIEQTAGDLVKKSWSEPAWDKSRGRVMGKEHVTFLGLTLVADRSVDFGKVQPKQAREVFIAEALVAGQLGRPVAFLEHNVALVEDIEAMEDRFRRRDIRASDQTLVDFYDRRLPDTVFSAASLESWWNDVVKQDPGLLNFDSSLVSRVDDADSAESDFPESMLAGGVRLDLEYCFKPGADDDGVTAMVPLEFLNRLDVEDFQWLVPGLNEERLVAVFKALPKQTRTRLVPVPDTVRKILAELDREKDLRRQLSALVKAERGVEIRAADWPFVEVPDHLRMRFRLVDADGDTLAVSRDLERLKADHSAVAATSFSSRANFDIERDGIVKWDFGDLPERVSLGTGDGALTGFPALVDMTETCAVRVFDSPQKARRLTRLGLRRLAMLELPGLRRMLARKLPGIEKICLLYSSIGSCDALKEDISTAALDASLGGTEDTVRSEGAFANLKQTLKSQLPREAASICQTLETLLADWQKTRTLLTEVAQQIPKETVDDVTGQMNELVYTGFVAKTSRENLAELSRYLKAIRHRLDRARIEPAKDGQRYASISETMARVNEKISAHCDSGEFDELRWMIEELRVSVFAQALGTAMPISAKRVEKRIAQIESAL